MDMTVQDLINQYQTGAAAGGYTTQDSFNDPIKVASEAGAKEAETMMKVAGAIGDMIGDRTIQKLAAWMGYDEDVVKVASFQDLMLDSMCKVAEDIQGTTPQAAAEQTNVEKLQIGEAAAHAATMAANCASDAVQSIEQGDQHTSAHQLETAQRHLEVAQQHAVRTDNPAVHSHVQAAADIVATAAASVQQAAVGAPQI